jgi:hypothetical protein
MASGLSAAIGVVSGLGSAARNIASLASGDISDGVINLGGIAINGMDLPEMMSPSGTQKINRQWAPGGSTNAFAMGTDYPPIVLKGIFYGSDALQKCHAIEAMRDQAQIQTLTFSDYAFEVLVETFTPRIRDENLIAYETTCIVLTNDSTAAQGATVDDGFFGSLNSAVQSVQSTITTATAYLSKAVATVASVTGPLGISIPFLNKVQTGLVQVSGAAATVGSLTAGAAAASANISALGGVNTTLQSGLSSASGTLNSSTATFNSTASPQAAAQAFVGVQDSATALATGAQAQAFTGTASANAATATGAALTPIPVPPIPPT